MSETAQRVEYETPFPLVDYIINFENGEGTAEEALQLFQYLVDTGQAWQLQGTYGRFARDLLEAGLIALPEDGDQ